MQKEDLAFLIVDDNETIQHLFIQALEFKGYEVHATGHSTRALEILETKKIDMAFIDMVLKDESGLELYKKIKDINPNVHVVLMTGYAVEDQIRQAMALGAFDYLYKPFDLSDIMSVVKKYVKQKGLKWAPEEWGKP